MTPDGQYQSSGISGRREFDLARLIAVIWREKITVILVTLLTLILSIAYLSRAEYRYTATLGVVEPQSSSNGLLSQLGNVAGLSALTGGRLPGSSGATLFLNYGENLQSATTARALSRDKVLLKQMFPLEWNAVTRQWQKPASTWGDFVDGVKRVFGIPVYAWQQPDAARVQDFLERHMNIVKDQRNPIMEISYSDADPKFAARLLTRLHDVVDKDLRRRAYERADANARFLLTQLRLATLADHRAALAQALSEQEKTRMLAMSSGPFAAEPVSTVSVSLRPTWPRPFLVLAAGLVAGLGLGVLAAVAMDFWRAQRRQKSSRA